MLNLADMRQYYNQLKIQVEQERLENGNLKNILESESEIRDIFKAKQEKTKSLVDTHLDESISQANNIKKEICENSLKEK